MLYKTIVLELIQQRPNLYDQLLRTRTVLATVDHYAITLKTMHEQWKTELETTRPGSDPLSIASEALELALQQFQDHLPPESLDENEIFSLDAAMAYLRRHILPA